MKYPDWYKQFREVETVALKGAPATVRAVYHYLRAHSPGIQCEPVKGLTVREIAAEMSLGKTTVTNSFKELEKRKLIKRFKSSPKEGVEFQFCFDYPQSTIKIVRGQVVVNVPTQVQRDSGFVPDEVQTVPRQGQTVPEGEQLPYIERDQEHIYASLKNQITEQLKALKIFPRMFEPIIKTPIGVRFVKDILESHPNEGGPVIRIKIQDEKNFNQFKIIDMFRREASQVPNGAVLRDVKTGDKGEWAWNGKGGQIYLAGGVRYVNDLAEWRHWEVA